MPPKFFITHSWKDIEFARRLCDDFRAHGVEGFLDAHSINPGDSIPSRIERGLKDCDVYIPVFSPDALQSGWCDWEIDMAIVMKMKRGRPQIIPVICRPCDVPDRLMHILYIDFVARYDDAFRELLTKGFGVTMPPPNADPPKPAPAPAKPQREPPAPRIVTPPAPEILTPPKKPATLPERFTHPETGAEMILIPTGEFVMGSDDYGDEKPRHKVHLDAFYIARYPVTNAEYKQFVDAEKHRAPKHWSGGKIPMGKDNHPVVYVDWNDAQAYCRWLTAKLKGKSQKFKVERDGQLLTLDFELDTWQVRLPTEAEWEKAARGTDGRKYPWGNEPPDGNRCNFNDNEKGTTPVGKYSPRGDSPYEVGDMAGNVWEWCSSLYKSYPYRGDDGREDLKASGSRVLRGGAWRYNSYSARAAFRDAVGPSYFGGNVGFRCARSP